MVGLSGAKVKLAEGCGPRKGGVFLRNDPTRGGGTCYGGRHMLKKDFLLLQHDDWTRNLAGLRDRIKGGAPPRSRQLDEIRKAEEWVTYYASLLHKDYGVTVRGPHPVRREKQAQGAEAR